MGKRRHGADGQKQFVDTRELREGGWLREECDLHTNTTTKKANPTMMEKTKRAKFTLLSSKAEEQQGGRDLNQLSAT